MAVGSLIVQLDPDCRCACHGPHMIAVCCVCKKPYELKECAPEQAGKESGGYCGTCFPKAMLEIETVEPVDPKAETRRRTPELPGA